MVISGAGNSAARLFQQQTQLLQLSRQNQQNPQSAQAVDNDGDNDHGAPESANEQHIDVRV